MGEDINGVVKLEKFIKPKEIDLLWIDNAKSVSSRAGWSFIDNDSVHVFLEYLKEIVAAPHGCHIGFISHDGTETNSAFRSKKFERCSFNGYSVNSCKRSIREESRRSSLFL